MGDDPRARHIRVRRMTAEDVSQVVGIELRSFDQGWPPTAFETELRTNGAARYVVIETQDGEDGGWRIAGFGGIWLQFDQAHIVTVAVEPEARRGGYGALIVHALLVLAECEGMADATLEVRVSNEAARALYRRFGFYEVGERRRYYADTGEDAVIMTTRALTDADHRARIGQLRAAAEARFPGALDGFSLERVP